MVKETATDLLEDVRRYSTCENDDRNIEDGRGGESESQCPWGGKK